MKKLMMSLLSAVLFITAVSAQETTTRTGYDGDFFSLEGALQLFKDSRSLEEFEKKLNYQDSHVNNLDLDGDGQVDYVRVEHRHEGDIHAVVLQIPVSSDDMQDVAVIGIEKTGHEKAILQIIGDEYLYGDEIIAEPFDIEVGSDGRKGPSPYESYEMIYGINVYFWPIVHPFFGRNYHPYISPYRYAHYPSYYRHYSPYSWDRYYGYTGIYRRHYRIVSVHRVFRAHNFYRPSRRYYSGVFHRTNNVRVNRGRKPYYHANEPHYNGRRSRSGSVGSRSTRRTPSTTRGSNSRVRSRGNSSGSSRARTGRSTRSGNTRVQSPRGQSRGSVSRGSSTRVSPRSQSRSGVSRGSSSRQRSSRATISKSRRPSVSRSSGSRSRSRSSSGSRRGKF